MKRKFRVTATRNNPEYSQVVVEAETPVAAAAAVLADDSLEFRWEKYPPVTRRPVSVDYHTIEEITDET